MDNYLSKTKHLIGPNIERNRGILSWCCTRTFKLCLVFTLILFIIYNVYHLIPTQHLHWERLTPSSLLDCPLLPNGSRTVIQNPVPTIEELEKNLDWLELGGHYSPECKTKNRVAILVPYRNRPTHLPLFLVNMHPFLRKQQIEYTIFIVEQYGNGTFNKGSLINGGYKEARKLRKFDCIILNDVDHIPEFYENLYSCPEQPRHMAQGIRIFNVSYDFYSSFGGVFAMANEHYELINGFSNRFWGWGGEDDDMYYRIFNRKLKITRYPHDIAWYTMLRHEKVVPNPQRFKILEGREKYFDSNGLNNVNYKLIKIEEKKLYTHILIDILGSDAAAILEALPLKQLKQQEEPLP